MGIVWILRARSPEELECHVLKTKGVATGCSKGCMVRDVKFECNVTVLIEAWEKETKPTLGPATREYYMFGGRIEMMETMKTMGQMSNPMMTPFTVPLFRLAVVLAALLAESYLSILDTHPALVPIAIVFVVTLIRLDISTVWKQQTCWFLKETDWGAIIGCPAKPPTAMF